MTAIMIRKHQGGIADILTSHSFDQLDLVLSVT